MGKSFHRQKFSLYFLIALLFNCTGQKESKNILQNNKQNNKVSIKDYYADEELFARITKASDCDTIMKLVCQLKTIDYLTKIKRFVTYCDSDFREPSLYKYNPYVDNVLSDIMQKDQEIRDSLYSMLNSLNDVNRETYVKLYIAIVIETDSLNFLKFEKLLDSIGEWPGAKYRKRIPSAPNIEVFIGHMDVKDYERYTLMAYESARQGMEYWSRVTNLFNFVFKFPIYYHYHPKVGK